MSDEKKSTGVTRNTNIVSNARSRAWCFTLNNYTVEDISQIQRFGGILVMQEEMGEKGTPHLQGVIRFNEKKSFGQMRDLGAFLSKPWHLEVCKNWIASRQYCSKESTRIGTPIVQTKIMQYDDYIDKWMADSMEFYLNDVKRRSDKIDHEFMEYMKRKYPKPDEIEELEEEYCPPTPCNSDAEDE